MAGVSFGTIYEPVDDKAAQRIMDLIDSPLTKEEIANRKKSDEFSKTFKGFESGLEGHDFSNFGKKVK